MIGNLTPIQLIELNKEIQGNYLTKGDCVFQSRNKDDIRQKLFNVNYPCANITLNGVDFRIAEGLLRDGKKSYLLYMNRNIIGEYTSIESAKLGVKLSASSNDTTVTLA